MVISEREDIGLLGDRLGLRATLLVSGVGMVLALFWVFFSSIRHAREFPKTSPV